jgi:glutamate/tyrosine decarboxylase-like PLP-dependent enzyme
MDLLALADAIQTDREHGGVPVMIAATAGTTDAGLVDPLAACAAIAQSEALWFHVDAAWGGALIASDRLHRLVHGLELADSLTIDAHKWFATTMGCGMFLTRWPAVLSSAFQVSASYMPSNTATVDPYVTTVQWSRRFLGLRLFLSLAAAGWRGYAEQIERSIALIGLLRDQMAALGWLIANEALLAVLCLEPPPGSADVRSIVRHVVSSGHAWVSVAVFEGRDVVRACVTNAETREDDIMALADVLHAAASECRA